MLRRLFAILCLVGCALPWPPQGASAAELVVWHDKGDDGIRMFEEIAAEYRRAHPDVQVRSLSFPTDQWFARTIAGLNTGSAPDLLFNDYVRIARIQLTTRKLTDLRAAFDRLPQEDRQPLGPTDLRTSTYNGAMVMLPVQRVLIGWGVRRSWLEAAREAPPRSWDDVLRVARAFQARPAGGAGGAQGSNGGETFGMALQAGDADSLINMIEAFMAGTGLENPTVDDAGTLMIDKPEHARVLVEYLKVFTQYKLVSPDTVNHGFIEMYQMIEGGRAGMFRAGNWNVTKWDREALRGDYLVGGWPLFGGPAAAPATNGSGEDDRPLILSSMRGIAVPTNAPNREAATEFARFMLSRGAQAASLRNMGGAIRADLPTEGLTEHLRAFAESRRPIVAVNFPETTLPWYPRFKAAYFKLLVAALNGPPKDWDAWVAATARELRAEIVRLKR